MTHTARAAQNIANTVERIQSKYIASGTAKLAAGERLNVCERTYMRQAGLI